MKYKLSAIALAMMPAMATASIDISSVEGTKYQEDSVIVIYKKDASPLDRRSARTIVRAKVSDTNKDEIDDKYQNILGGRLANYKLDKMSSKQAIEKLKKHPAVLYVEPDYIVHAATTNDPSFDSLWGLNNTGQTGGTEDADIDAPEAWDISIGSRDVVVGVIDSGVDHTHPDLNANMWVNPGEIPGDGIDNDNNGYVDDIHGINAIVDSGDPMDDNGHGTHVAGTIGAVGNNSEGVVGVNQEVSIIGCKFLSASGSGSTADALKCIDYMVGLRNNGVNVRVLNNSWGGGGFNQSMFDAISSSEEAGIMFVAAAGNDALDNDVTPHYPSSYEHDSVVSVASTTHTDAMSSFSQWGLTSVDLGAPGSSILSTWPGGGYNTISGTSMATPHVAGAAALALSVNPDLSVLELKELLLSSGDDNEALAGLTVSGKRLNAHQAALDADPTPSFRFSVTPRNVELVAGETATYTFDVGSIAEWEGDVALTLTSSVEAASLSATIVSPGDSFTLTVPTTEDTAWGDYEFTVTGTSGELVREQQVSLFVNPQGLNDFTYSNDTVIDIPDNDDTGISSVISIPDEITIFDTSAFIDITHTYIGDLTVSLTSPAGTTAILHNRAGGSADDISRSFDTSSFNGEVATGDWTLTVTDSAGLDTGSLNSWAVTFTGLGEVGPAAPVANFSFEIDTLTVDFTDSSTDVNGDIVSWAWDFGDGATSTEQSPIYTYAEAGSYEVTLLVTDSEGNTSTKSASVVVSDVDIELAVTRAYLTRLGRLRVDIEWQGSSAETVDIYRNGVKIDTVDNTGIYRDRERRVTGTEFIYTVCETADICSNEVTVNF